MRVFLVLLVALLVAGCAAPATNPPANNSSSNSSVDSSMLPPPINETKQVQGAFQPVVDPQTGDPCSLPTAGCFHHKFIVNASAKMDATLSWGVEASDFDLFLYKGKAIFKQDSAPPPGTSAKLTETLEEAEYDLVVVASSVAQDTYKLAVTFSAS